MNHWALRCEASHRSSCLAKLGFLPTHVPSLAANNARSSSKPLAHQLVTGRFDPDRTFPPPHDLESIVTLTRTQLLESLETDPQFAGMRRVAKQTILRLVTESAEEITDIACDLFWACVLSMYLTAVDDATKPGNVNLGAMTRPTSFLFDTAQLGQRPSTREQVGGPAEATWQEIEEVFVAACPPCADALDVPSLVHLLSKMQLTVTQRTLPDLLNAIRGDKGERTPQSPKAIRRMSSGAALRHRALSASGPRNSGGADALQASMSASSIDLSATAAKALPEAATGKTLSKHQFISWCFVVRLCDADRAQLRGDMHRYIERSTKRFHRRVSPFAFPLEVRDAVELPLCLVMASLLTAWLRASVAMPTVDGPRDMSSAEQSALRPVVEAFVTQWLVGLPITCIGPPSAPSRVQADGSPSQRSVPRGRGRPLPSAVRGAGKHDGTARVTGPSPQPTGVASAAVPQPATAVTPPQSHLHATTPSGVDATHDSVAATAMSMQAAMFAFSKAARFGSATEVSLPLTAQEQAIAVGGAAGGLEGAMGMGVASTEDHRRVELLVEQNASVYHSLETLLRITDAEVQRERSRGGEANIHRAATYIAAQQRLVDEVQGRRQAARPDGGSGEGAAASSSAPGVALYLPLDAMLRDELRPDCVRRAVQDQRVATAPFASHGAAPLGPLDRLSIVQSQSVATAESLEQPFTARRRTAPVGDIASATSQRSIAKHALRLSQQLEGERSMKERMLERIGLQLIKDYKAMCLGARQVNQNADDAELHRIELKRLHEAFDQVLQDASFLFLKADTRLAILQGATHIGKAYRGVSRRGARQAAVVVPSASNVGDCDDGPTQADW